jgi:PAS domain S-box-containing protein
MGETAIQTPSSPEILIVEDSKIEAAILKHLLEREGYRTRVAQSVKHAFENLRQGKPDLIISDVVMPETDGFEFAYQIKHDDTLSTIPVILLTGLSEAEDIFRGLASGADYYITKPYDDAYLLSKVGSVLGQRFTLRKELDVPVEFEVRTDEQPRVIRATVQRLVDLLLCTYENSIQINHKLRKTQQELLTLNHELEAKVQQRTAHLRTEIEHRKHVELELQKAHDELERRVEERTAELAQANKDLRKEIRQRQTAEEAIKRSEAKYRLLVDNAPVGILFVDKLGRIMEVNPRLRDLLAAPTIQEVSSLNVLKAPTFAQSGVSALFRTAMEQSRITTAEMPFKSAWGVESYFNVTVTPVRRSDGAVYGAQAVIEDISERKKAEQIKLETERARSLSEMGELVAHNFNNILQVVIGGAQLALTNLELGNSDDIKSSLEQILESALAGAETVKRLQYLVRFEKDIRPRHKVLDLSLEAHKAIEMSRLWWQTAPRKLGIKITLDRRLESECFVKGNSNELFTLVVNLIRNATEELTDGGRIGVQTSRSSDQVILQVRTEGAVRSTGGAESASEALWNQRLDLCRPVVKGHGGEIVLNFRPGQGSTVVVKFQLCAQETDESREVEASELGRGLKILLVDDLAPVLRTIRDGLLLYGHDVTAVLSGKKAIELFRLQSFDAVVSDLGMPELNGWEIGKEIKRFCEQNGIPKTPFVLITGWPGDRYEEQRLIESGVDRIVEKPVETKGLVEVLEQVRKEARP